MPATPAKAAAAAKVSPATVDPTADPEVARAAVEHPESVVSPVTAEGAPVAPAYVGPVDATGKPLPETELTPEQVEIRRLRDALAIQDATSLETREDVYDEATAESPEDSIVVHFLVDGFIAGGVIWYRGQEVEFVRGSAAFNQTKDKNGKSWLDLATPAGEMEQARRWGEVKFRAGQWPGNVWADPAAVEAERRRNRAAPVMSTR